MARVRRDSGRNRGDNYDRHSTEFQLQSNRNSAAIRLDRGQVPTGSRLSFNRITTEIRPFLDVAEQWGKRTGNNVRRVHIRYSWTIARDNIFLYISIIQILLTQARLSFYGSTKWSKTQGSTWKTTIYAYHSWRFRFWVTNTTCDILFSHWNILRWVSFTW